MFAGRHDGHLLRAGGEGALLGRSLQAFSRVMVHTVKVFLDSFCGIAAIVSLGSATAAHAQEVTIRQGSDVIGRFPMPGTAKVVAWDAAVTDAAASQRSRLGVVWTVRTVRNGRSVDETSAAWCERTCGRARRVDQRSGGTSPVASVAVLRDRALVRFGPFAHQRWALLDGAAKRIATGSSERWGAGGGAALAVTSDGTVWAGSRTRSAVVWMQGLVDGRRFAPASGTVLATGADSLSLHALGAGLAATWSVRPNADEGLGRTMWAAGAPSELRDPAHQSVLTEHGSPATISGTGSDRTVVSWVDAEVRPGSAGYRAHARAAWVDASGGQQPDVGASTDFGALDPADVETGWAVNAFEPAGGGAALCPLGLFSSGAGAQFAPGFRGCPPTWRVKVSAHA